MALEFIFFILLSLVTSLVSAVFGLGSALFILALGPYILPVKQVIVLSSVLFAASTIAKTCIFRRSIQWRLTIEMSLISFPFAYFGASLVDIVPAVLLQRILGATIIAYCLLNALQCFPKHAPGQKLLLLGSAGYGFVSGLIGSGNIIKAILFHRLALSKEAFVGAMAATSILANIAKLSAYSVSGLLRYEHLNIIMGLIVAAVAAALLGRFALRRISANYFNYLLQGILFISAVGLMFK